MGATNLASHCELNPAPPCLGAFVRNGLQRRSSAMVKALRRAQLGLCPRAPVGVPVEESHHVADHQIEQPVRVPIGQDRIAVPDGVQDRRPDLSLGVHPGLHVLHRADHHGQVENAARLLHSAPVQLCAEAGLQVPMLRVDGGGTANEFLMQFQADILGIPIQVAKIPETTALGAAYLAGLSAGLWQDTTEIARMWQASRTYEPNMSIDQREVLYTGWKRAVERARY